jgi:colicin import membrane protein
MRPLAVLALCAAAALGCSSPQRAKPQPTTVSAADVGRLSPEQMGAVQSARSDVDAARDALDRARLRLQDARHEEWYARADRTQADADRQRGEAQLRAAQEAGDGRAAGRAQELVAAAALRAQAADARLEYARRLIAARQSGVDAYQARVARAEWDVERAKLAALREAQIPAASKYDAASLDRRGADLARAEDASVARSRELDRQATTAFDRWRSLVDRYEARLRASGQTG